MCCGCGHAGTLAVISDGGGRSAASGARGTAAGRVALKIMASGGIASPSDPLERSQYSDEEIRAAVDEAKRAGSYVAAHCHPA
jgi:imidazolonepropionase-like amidohydrolase